MTKSAFKANRPRPFLIAAAFGGLLAWPIGLSAQSTAEVAKLTASDASSDDLFGLMLSINHDRAVITAGFDDHAGFQSGSAYMFRRVGGAWIEEQKLTASDAAAGDYFGRSASVDGDRVAIGAPSKDGGAGAVYVFRYDDSNWIEEAKLVGSDGAPLDAFGIAVGIRGDLLAIGASQDPCCGGFGPGKVYLFVRDDNDTPDDPADDTWAEDVQLTAGDASNGDALGFSLQIADDADSIIVGAYKADAAGSDSGAAYLFRRDGDAWVEDVKLVPDNGVAQDKFGADVTISGDRVAVGADQFSVPGGAGRAFIFRRDESIWVQEAEIVGDDSAADDLFGATLHLEGDALLVGAREDDDDGGSSGSAYVFRRDDKGTPGDPADDSWPQQAKITASDAAAGATFGQSVGFDGDTAIVSAPRDDEMGNDSGAAYVFELFGPLKATLLSFSVFRGELLAGDLQALEESDDDYVEIDAHFNDAQAVYVSRTLIRAKSPATTVSRLDLTVETGVEGEPVLTRVLLRNFDTGDWDLLEGFSQSEADSEAMIMDVPSPNAYVGDDQGQIGVRIETRAYAAQVPDGYVFRIDHVQLTVTTDEGGGIAGGDIDDDETFACDLDGDGIVGSTDLLILLGAWGHCNDCNNCTVDLDHDCTVGAVDLLELLGNWGPCP